MGIHSVLGPAQKKIQNKTAQSQCVYSSNSERAREHFHHDHVYLPRATHVPSAHIYIEVRTRESEGCSRATVDFRPRRAQSTGYCSHACARGRVPICCRAARASSWTWRAIHCPSRRRSRPSRARCRSASCPFSRWTRSTSTPCPRWSASPSSSRRIAAASASPSLATSARRVRGFYYGFSFYHELFYLIAFLLRKSILMLFQFQSCTNI